MITRPDPRRLSAESPPKPSPPKPLSLRANFVWTFAGNVVYAASSWLMLVVLAKLGTPEIVGQFALGIAITAPVIGFANLQLRQIQMTDVKHDYRFRDYFGLRLVMLALALVAIAGIVLLSAYKIELALTIVVIGCGKAVDAISDVIYGLLQQHEQMDRIAVSLILKGLLSLLLLFLGQYLTHRIVWAAVGWSLASVIVVVGYDLHSVRPILQRMPANADSLVPRFKFAVLKKLTWLALPLGITMLLLSLLSNIPRYFIEFHSGERDLGIFAAMTYIMAAGSTLINALGQAASPRLARQYMAGKRQAFQWLLLKLVGICALLGVVSVLIAFLAGPLILTVLYQPEYATRNDVFLWLMAAAGVAYIAAILSYAVTAIRYFKIQPVVFGLCAISMVGCCVIWIPAYGLLGAAWAIIVSSSVQLVLLGMVIVYAIVKVK